MRLEKLLAEVEYDVVKGSLDKEISDIVYDSRKVEKDCLFLCVVGSRMDSHDFISEAVKAGAVAIVMEKDVEVAEDVTVIRVENSKKALSYMSAAYFEYPARELTTIAITGTKGKTTTAYMTKELLEAAGKKTGIVGTIGAFYKDVQIETHNTTPESYEIQQIFRQMADAGVTHVVMEVSSQAYLTNRVAGMEFDYGVYTNLSPDHIGEGEHKDFAEYLSCKSQLFQHCRTGIFNVDDEHVEEIQKGHTCEVRTFSTKQEADLTGKNIVCYREPGFIGIKFDVTGAYEMTVEVGCMGRFNAYNALAAMSVAALLGISGETVQKVMYHMSVRGRVEPVHISEHFHLIIDYAHNAVSAESLLVTMREYQPKRLVTVFGAGGNRSRLRRFDMGEISGKYADLSVLTSDNPRFEKPEDIIDDIETGIKKTAGTYIRITNRKDAIRYVIEHAQEGDLIALFGKGHEDYQEIEGIRYPFDERDVIADIVKELGDRIL